MGAYFKINTLFANNSNCLIIEYKKNFYCSTFFLIPLLLYWSHSFIGVTKLLSRSSHYIQLTNACAYKTQHVLSVFSG